MNVALDPDDALVAVSLYGDFTRPRRPHRRPRGGPPPARRRRRPRRLPAPHRPRPRAGTPFITQRFWEVDFRTRRGRDCGRATSGVGEVLQTWSLRGKVYLASYTRGELVEYDPAAPAATREPAPRRPSPARHAPRRRHRRWPAPLLRV